MLQQSPPRLNEYQKETIEVILRQAISKNETFSSVDGLADYLRIRGFADSLLQTESKLAIFDIYLRLIHNSTQPSQHQQQQPRQSSQQPIQPLSSSPTSTSSYSEPAPNPAKVIPEELEGRDDVEPLNFLERVSQSSEQIVVYADKLGSLRHYHIPSLLREFRRSEVSMDRRRRNLHL
jgi:hypothetical protein